MAAVRTPKNFRDEHSRRGIRQLVIHLTRFCRRSRLRGIVRVSNLGGKEWRVVGHPEGFR